MKPNSKVTVHAETQLAIIHRYGDMTLEQMISGVDTLFSNPEFADTTSIISDLTHASLTITSEEMAQHAEYCRRLFEKSKQRIVIIAPDTVDFGMARMFELLTKLPNVMVVKTREAAYEWLGIRVET